MTLRRLVPAACAGLLIYLAGCSSNTKSGSADGFTPNDALLEVANILRDYNATHNRPPTKVADLAPYESLYQIGYRAVKSGDVVVIWGGSVGPEGGGGGGGAVVAYEKQVPESGGSVLLENGTIKQMTAAEFAAAPKAKK